MKKCNFCKSVLLLIISVGMMTVFPNPALSKDIIRIGATISLSGPLAPSSDQIHLAPYKMWVEEVNARGGIYLREMKKSLPLELVVYDDEGDIQKGIALYQKLILEDRVDLLLPPCGSGMNFAVIPVANQHGYPLIVMTAALESLRQMAYKLPYFFMISSMPREIAFALGEILSELKIKKAAVLYNDCTHGLDTTNALVPGLKARGISIPLIKSYPLSIQDFSPLLKDVRAADAEALLVVLYPKNAFQITQQARDMGLNPKLLYLSIGVSFPEYRDHFGADTVEGIISNGVWNPGLPYPGAKDFFERYTRKWNREPDRCNTAFTYASLQVLEQAISEVGSLDRKKIRDVIAEKTFSTIIGPVKFERGFNINTPGEIGQWQNGEFEVAGPKSKRTTNLIYPKPEWKK